jgi:hypothetical protein
MRVQYTATITPHVPNKYVRITGIRSVEGVVLANDAFVNGEYRRAGEILYLPVVILRDQSDIVLQRP